VGTCFFPPETRRRLTTTWTICMVVWNSITSLGS
jgi:hypothetical protein